MLKEYWRDGRPAGAPDGYYLHFESPTDVPEDTVYRDSAEEARTTSQAR